MADDDLRWEARSVSDVLLRAARQADARGIAAVHAATWQHAARLTSPVTQPS